MMKYCYLAFASASVSIDGLLAGVSLAGRRDRIRAILVITSAVLTLCLGAHFLGKVTVEAFSDVCVGLSGILLILLGLHGYLEKEKSPVFVRNKGVNCFARDILTGFGVGADGALASLSLSLEGFGVYSALTVTAFHLLFLTVGSVLTRARLMHRLSRYKLQHLILIVLGMTRLI